MAKKEKRSKNIVKKAKNKQVASQKGDSLDQLPPNSTLRALLEHNQKWAKATNAASKKLHNRHEFKIGSRATYADRYESEQQKDTNRRF